MDPLGSPHSPEEDTSFTEPNVIYQRGLRSLRLTATKFVKMLQEAEGCELDLKEVSQLRPGC